VKTSILQKTKEKEIVAGSVKGPSKLERLTAGLALDYGALSEILAVVYKKAYFVEQAYMDECVSNKAFCEKYPRFYLYMSAVIPQFDMGEYYKYKPIIEFDKQDLLPRLTNAAFKLIGARVFSHRKNAFHPRAADIFSELPATGVITDTVVIPILAKHGITRKGKKKNSVGDVRNIKYTKKTLAKLTKNDLLELCLKLQSSLSYYKDRYSRK
jgi:hypothetical protein